MVVEEGFEPSNSNGRSDLQSEAFIHFATQPICYGASNLSRTGTVSPPVGSKPTAPTYYSIEASLAERAGFEPARRILCACELSKLVHSAALPSLQCKWGDRRDSNPRLPESQSGTLTN